MKVTTLVGLLNEWADEGLSESEELARLTARYGDATLLLPDECPAVIVPKEQWEAAEEAMLTACQHAHDEGWTNPGARLAAIARALLGGVRVAKVILKTADAPMTINHGFGEGIAILEKEDGYE